MLAATHDGSIARALHWMGVYPLGLVETVKGLALTAILFLGPLFEAGVADGAWRDWIRLHGLRSEVGSWIGWRNFVAVCVSSDGSWQR